MPSIDKYLACSFSNFLFLRPRSYECQPSSYGLGGTHSEIATYVEDESCFFDIVSYEKMPMVEGWRPMTTIGAARRLVEVVDHFVSQIGDQVLDYRIIEVAQNVEKTVDHSDDIASFDCRRVRIRTSGRRHNTKRSARYANRDICISVIQRKFIPPMMDQYQNVVVLCVGSLDRAHENKQHCDTITSTLCTRATSFAWDAMVVQTKADALMLDEESFDWYAKHLHVYPETVDLARSFCASILNILAAAGLPFPTENLFPGLDGEIGDDPFEYSLRMENQIPGWSGGETPNREALLVREWKTRVWRYLAFCVDGGLLPGVLDITKIAQHSQQYDRRLQKIGQVVQTLLYFRAVDQEFEQVALALKITDERLMRNVTFNERVMETLLRCGYIKDVLDAASDSLEYPRFIVRLIHRGRERSVWGHMLKYTVCKQLARSSASLNKMTGEQANIEAPLNDLALHTVIPALLELLNDPNSGELIQVLVVSTLVNFTKNNSVIKNKIMSGGAIQRVCQFLHSKHDDLVRHSCSLLNNCTKSDQYRGQVAKFKAVESLMRLLQRDEFPPHYRSSRILVQACAVIGNLASDTRLRQKITDALGYEIEVDSTFEGQRFQQSRSIRVLVDLLKDRYRELAQRESLRVTVIFALKNLSIRHEENKRTIGRLAIETLLNIVYGIMDEEKSRILIDVALRCLYVLSFERSNCKILELNHVDKVLQAHQTSFPEITKQIQLKMNKNLA